MQSYGESARIILVALVLGGAGAVFKILGGLLYGSRAVFIDGATCIGNIVAGILLYRSLRAASKPPDEDHPFGHTRLVYHGVLLVLVTYSFIAGLSTAVLYYSLGQAYSVEEGAPLFALIGTLFYGASIMVSRRQGYAGGVFSAFTFTEVIEGAVTITASYTAVHYGKVYDIAGGLLITMYLVYELWSESQRLGVLMSDTIDPTILRRIRSLFEERGLRVKSIRLRTVVPGKYHGDMVVEAVGIPYEVADLLVDEASYIAREEYNVDLTVHIDVRGRS